MSSIVKDVELTPEVLDAYNNNQTPKINRTYRGGLSVPREFQAALINHLESYTRGVRSAQGSLLNLLGALDVSLVEQAFPTVSENKVVTPPPTEQEKLARQIILTRLWLFPVSLEGAPSEYICGDATDKNRTIPQEEAKKRRAVLKEILTAQGLGTDEINDWLENCQYELDAPVTEGRCLVNTRQMYLDNREEYGADFGSDTPFELLNYIFGSPEDLLSLNLEDPQGKRKRSAGSGSVNIVQGMGTWRGRVRPSEKSDSTSIDFQRLGDLYKGLAQALSDIDSAVNGRSVTEVLPEVVDALSDLRVTKKDEGKLIPLSRDISGLVALFEEGANAKEKGNISKSALRKYLKEVGLYPPSKTAMELEIDTVQVLQKMKECCEVDALACSKQIPRFRKPYADSIIQDIEQEFGAVLSGTGPNNEGHHNNVLKAILGEAAQDISKTVTNVKKKMELRVEKQREVAEIRASIPQEKRELLEGFCKLCNSSLEGKRYFIRDAARFLPAIVKEYGFHASNTVEARIEAMKQIVHENRDASKRRGGYPAIFNHLATPEGLTVLQDEQGKFTEKYVTDFFRARDLEEKIQSRMDVDSLRMADPDYSLRSAPLSKDKGTKLGFGILELVDRIKKGARAYHPAREWFDTFRSERKESLPEGRFSFDAETVDTLEGKARALFKKWKAATADSSAYQRWFTETEQGATSLEEYRRSLVFSMTEEDSLERIFLSHLASDSAWDAWHLPAKNGKEGGASFKHLRVVLEAYEAQEQLRSARATMQSDMAAGSERPIHPSEDTSNPLNRLDMTVFDGQDFVENPLRLGSDRLFNELLFGMYSDQEQDNADNSIVTVPRDTTFARAAFGANAHSPVRVAGLADKEEAWFSLVKVSKATKEKLRTLAQSDLTPEEKALRRERIVSQARMEILTTFELKRLPGVVGEYLHQNGMDLFPAGKLHTFLKNRNVAEKRDADIAKLHLSRMPAGLRTASVRILPDAMAARVAIVETMNRDQLHLICDEHGVEYPDEQTRFFEVEDPKTGKKTKYVRNAADTYREDNGELTSHPSPWSRIERIETVRLPGDRRRGDQIRPTYRSERKTLRRFAAVFHCADVLNEDVIYNLQDARKVVHETLDKALERQETLALAALGFNPQRTLPLGKAVGKEITLVDAVKIMNALSEIGKRHPLKRSEHEALYREHIEPLLTQRDKESLDDNAIRSKAFTKLRKLLIRDVNLGLKRWYGLAYHKENPDLELKALFELRVLPYISEEDRSKLADSKKRPGLLYRTASNILSDESKLQDLWQATVTVWTKREKDVSQWVPKIRDWHGGSTKLIPSKKNKDQENQSEKDTNNKRIYPSEGGLSLPRFLEVNAFRSVDKKFVSRATPHGKHENKNATIAQAKYVQDDLHRRDAARDELAAEILRSVLGIVDHQSKSPQGDAKVEIRQEKILRYSQDRSGQEEVKYEQRYAPCHICIFEDEMNEHVKVDRSSRANATRAIVGKKMIKANVGSALDLLDIGFFYAAPERIQRNYATGAAMLRVQEVSINEFIRQDTGLWTQISDAKRRVQAQEAADENNKPIAKSLKPTATDYYLCDLEARYDRETGIWTDRNNCRWQPVGDGSWQNLEDQKVSAPQPIIVPRGDGNLLISATPGQKLVRSHNTHTNAVLRNALKRLQDPDWSPHVERLNLNAQTGKPIAKEVKGARTVRRQDKISVLNQEEIDTDSKNPEDPSKKGKAESYYVYRDPSEQGVTEDVWLRVKDYEDRMRERAVAKLREHLDIEPQE